jgi:hypothetical protein
VAAVVEVEVFNPQQLTGPSEHGADADGFEWEDLRLGGGHQFDDPAGLRREVTPNIVADFSAGVFHIPHENPISLEILPADAGDLLLPAG